MGFDLHIHSDRKGRTRVSFTDPTGKRSEPHVLSLHGSIALVNLLRAVVGERALEWLSAPHEPDA